MAETIILGGSDVKKIANSMERIAKAFERMADCYEASVKQSAKLNEVTVKMAEAQLESLKRDL